MPYLIFVLLLLNLSCARLPEITEPLTTDPLPDDFPFAAYQQAKREGFSVYRLSGPASELRGYVFREGKLATLGHNHVFHSRRLGGLVRWQTRDMITGDLYLPVNSLIVDAASRRSKAGKDFQSNPSAQDIAATRKNMLGKNLLQSEQFPFIRIHLPLQPVHPGDNKVATRITIHKSTRQLEVPLTLADSSTSWHVAGSFTLRQSDFGIKPYSVLSGLLKVKDEIRVEFELVLTPW